MKQIAVALSVYKNVLPEELTACLESIYLQSMQADLFVKVDGEVPEELWNMLKQDYDSGKIAYLDYRKENLGIARSFNELFKIILERGYPYIARMDSDDIMVLQRLKKQYNFMENHPDIDVVGGYIEEIGEEIAYKKTVMYPLQHHEMFVFFSKRVPMANVTTFFRKSFFGKAGLYPTESPTNEDTLFWMNGFAAGCRFANIPEVLVDVRISKDFFGRRGGWQKAWSDFRDRVKVIRTLRYNKSAYLYAMGIFFVNISPAFMKFFLYKRLR